MLFPQAAALTQRLWRLPTNASLHGLALDAHLLLNLWIGLALLALAHILILIGLAKHRTHTPPRRQAVFEFLPLAALALLFAFLATSAEALWQAARYTGPDRAALQVEVTGMQFAWYFRYPGIDATFGATRPELVAPGEGNPLGLDPTDPHSFADDLSPPATSYLARSAAKSIFAFIRRTSSTAGMSPRCVSNKTLSPARTSTSTSRPPPPATTRSCAPNFAASATIG